jgi:hypothetical protein
VSASEPVAPVIFAILSVGSESGMVVKSFLPEKKKQVTTFLEKPLYSINQTRCRLCLLMK